MLGLALVATTVAMLLTPVAASASDQTSGQAGLGAGPGQISAVTLRPGSGDINPRVSVRVRAVQARLQALGYLPGRIDGHFGRRTERAVRQFQSAHGLPVDGTVGARTLAALAAATPPATQPSPPPATRPSAPTATQSSPPPATQPSPSQSAPRARATTVHRAAHAGSSQLPIRSGLLVVAVLALLVGAGWYARRRLMNRSRDGRRFPTGGAGGAGDAFAQGLAHEQDSDVAGAEAAYRRADQRGHAAAASNLGVLLEERGDLRGAEAAYRRADERGDPNGAFNRGVLLERQRDVSGAEAAYRRADQRGHAAAASNLGVLLEERGDLPGAEAAYRRADERGDPNGAFNRAALLEEQSDLAGAEAAYRRADEHGDAEVAQTARAVLLQLGFGVSGMGVDDRGLTS
jgi:peptidoglycan hydrolase-like protein with peptidoglycan-binding domain